MQLYKHVKSRPPEQPLTDEELGEHEVAKYGKEKDALKAFLQYLAVTGPFLEWEENQIVFENIHVCHLTTNAYIN